MTFTFQMDKDTVTIFSRLQNLLFIDETMFCNSVLLDTVLDDLAGGDTNTQSKYDLKSICSALDIGDIIVINDIKSDTRHIYQHNVLSRELSTTSLVRLIMVLNSPEFINKSYSLILDSLIIDCDINNLDYSNQFKAVIHVLSMLENVCILSDSLEWCTNISTNLRTHDFAQTNRLQTYVDFIRDVQIPIDIQHFDCNSSNSAQVCIIKFKEDSLVHTDIIPKLVELYLLQSKCV